MSSDTPCRSLAEYVAELIARLGTAEPHAVARIREIVGARRARIRADDEAVIVFFGPDGFEVSKDDPTLLVDGEGTTSHQVVLDILDGYREVTEAVLDGDIEIRGTPDDVVRMGHAIEIILDGAMRNPSLQALADDYRGDPCLPPPSRSTHVPAGARTRWYPSERTLGEDEVLGRHGLREQA